MTVSKSLQDIYDRLVSILPPLVDVTDELDVATDCLSEEDRASLIESCACLIADYVTQNPLVMSKPDYSAIIKTSVLGLVEETMFPCVSLVSEEELDLVYQIASYVVFTTVIPRRSYRKTFVRKHKSPETAIDNKLQDIKDRPQSEQCTPQWYVDRWNRLSGSNAWKAFGSQAQINSLILEKCKPIETDKFQSVNTESSLHHGKRFEPVSTQYYEYAYGAKVGEFGCVPHKEHSFLGASPDGIVVNKECPRYGRMLEIKNVTTRKINGIPKEDYWIQMQLQMEVCDLNECDFLETEIHTYPSFADFESDGTFQKSGDGKYKGVIAQYQVDGKPFYEYAPFQCTQEEFDKWEEEICEQHANHTWISNIYYRIDTISCVLVLRNKAWMKAATDVLRDIWAQVLYDRENGYEHRKPKAKGVLSKKGNTTNASLQKPNCVINVMKLQDDGTDADDTAKEERIPKKRKTCDKTEQASLYVDIGSDDV